MTDADFPQTVARISEILIDLGVKFHVTGGVAASYYGDPRLTQDLNLVISLGVHQPETEMLLNRLSSGYLISRSAAIEAIASNGLFQAIDEASMVKIDFHVGEKIPGELGRSIRREIFPGLFGPLVSKEDAILSKLLWIQMGSGRARHDVKEMLLRDEDLDRDALRQRAAQLGLADLLAEMERSIRDARDRPPRPDET